MIGDRGPVTINPRVMMEKGTSVKGVMLFNQTVIHVYTFSRIGSTETRGSESFL